MKTETEQNVSIKKNKLTIKDSLKNQKNVSVRIEAAHSGIINGNFLFYLPKALESGAESLNKFYKPLQKKHYSKTLGYIYTSEYLETNTSSQYYKEIMSCKTSKELASKIQEYVKTKEYQENRTGFGVLVSKAKLHDLQKIKDLANDDVGTVSVAGDAGVAYCSICGELITTCIHDLGKRYKNNELCFGIIADDFEVDHISFETIPANWETNSLIIADSQLVGNIELIEEGHLMKISLTDLKEKLVNIESVLTELNLFEFLEQYKQEASLALNSQYLLSADKLLPFNTPLTTYVTQKLLVSLEDSEDKNILVELFGTSFSEIFSEKSEEEALEFLKTGEKTTVVVLEEPLKGEGSKENEPLVLSVSDSDKIALAIADSLVATFDNSFQNLFTQLTEYFNKNSEAKANELLTNQVTAYKEDLKSSENLTKVVTEQLKESLINQIVLLKNVSKDSDYVSKLQTRTVQELKMTLEDHLEDHLNKPTEVAPSLKEEPLKVEDSLKNKTLTPINKENIIEDMTNKEEAPLEITDADKTLNDILSTVTEKLNKDDFSRLYKKTVLEHGSTIAKKLRPALKAENKI